MAVVVVLVVALSLMLVVLLTRWARSYRRFRRLELAIRGPPSTPVLGSAIAVLRHFKTDGAAVVLRLWDGQPELFRIAIGNVLFLVVSDPDDIERLLRGKRTQDKPRIYEFLSGSSLLTVNGAKWRSRRRALQPAFNHNVVDRYQQIFIDESRHYVRCIATGEPVAVCGNLIRATASAFTRTAMSSHDPDVAERKTLGTLSHLVSSLMKALSRSFVSRVVQPWLWSDAVFHRTEKGAIVHRLSARVDAISATIVTQRRSRLLRERSEGAGDAFFQHRNTFVDVLIDEAHGGARLTDKEIMDEFNLFTGAAVESAAASMTWTLKVLSVRPDIQDRILQELQDLGVSSGAVSEDQISRLDFTERVIKESLRLFPPVPLVARKNHEEMDFGGKTIPADSVFLVNIYGVQRDSSHWNDPLRFDPDRFLPEYSVGRHPYAYVPFSAGSRNCIGSQYGMLLMKTLLASLLLAYRVDPVDDGHTEPADFPFTFDVTSRMPGGAKVVFNHRQSA